jgi:hypothetical protein
MAMAACGGSAPATVQNCGQLHSLNGHFLEAGDKVKQSESCFLQAFQQCSAATLTFQVSGVDAGVIHTFTTQNTSGTCSISDQTQHYVAPNPPQAGTAYICTGLTQQADGLHFSGCGDEGIVLVPAPSGSQACGVVETRANTVQDETSAVQAENCFWQAFQHCTPVMLVFRVFGVDTVLTHTFTTHMNGKACSITDAVQNVLVPPRPSTPHTYVCAGLTRAQDGLHFAACGNDGDVTVPV